MISTMRKCTKRCGAISGNLGQFLNSCIWQHANLRLNNMRAQKGPLSPEADRANRLRAYRGTTIIATWRSESALAQWHAYQRKGALASSPNVHSLRTCAELRRYFLFWSWFRRFGSSICFRWRVYVLKLERRSRVSRRESRQAKRKLARFPIDEKSCWLIVIAIFVRALVIPASRWVVYAMRCRQTSSVNRQKNSPNRRLDAFYLRSTLCALRQCVSLSVIVLQSWMVAVSSLA